MGEPTDFSREMQRKRSDGFRIPETFQYESQDLIFYFNQYRSLKAYGKIIFPRKNPNFCLPMYYSVSFPFFEIYFRYEKDWKFIKLCAIMTFVSKKGGTLKDKTARQFSGYGREGLLLSCRSLWRGSFFCKNRRRIICKKQRGQDGFGQFCSQFVC